MKNVNDIEVKQFVDLSPSREQIEIQEAKNFLKSKGYFVDNLWNVEDVMNIYDCTEKQAQEVLLRVHTNEDVMSQIWFSINLATNLLNIEKK